MALSLSACVTPLVEAPVSRDDVRYICAAVRHVTHKPVQNISAAIDTHPAPGAIRENWVAVSAHSSRPIKRYRRTDRVSVTVGGRGDISGELYEVQKIQGHWRVVGKGDWIH
jgi:hypothetical protein